MWGHALFGFRRLRPKADEYEMRTNEFGVTFMTMSKW